jgi:hypothetical protein
VYNRLGGVCWALGGRRWHHGGGLALCMDPSGKAKVYFLDKCEEMGTARARRLTCSVYVFVTGGRLGFKKGA